MKKNYELIIKKEIRNSVDGFSIVIKGELKRYVVANTHNEYKNIWSKEVQELLKQAKENMYIYDNVTIGGWTDEVTGKYYIDAGMSTDELEYALNVARYYKQLAIYDTKENKSIYL